MFSVPSVTTAESLDSALAAPGLGRKRKQVSYVHNDDDDDDAEDANFEVYAPVKKSKISKSIHDPTESALDEKPKKSPKKKGKGDVEVKHEEKRLRRFRARPPQSYLEVKARALSQRLTVLSRERCGTAEIPEEKILMAGSTGNVYTQHIGQVPRCDCPHANKGNQCKHIIYVMLRVLKAPEHVGYQLALTSSELRDLFKNAASIPNADASAGGQTAAEDGNRKPVEGECPICYTEFEPDEEIVYCKAACGNNVHKDCMQSWMAAKAGNATCPYCRAEWEGDEIGVGGNIDLKGAMRNEEGYVNVAPQLGLSGARDYSTYHQPWVRHRFQRPSSYRFGWR